ncbi:MAG: hypothetical protein E7589_01425 [Ruminococcaceae bacterium]|nr:hypothetical protein [Oscillospiraceae bacterium]
MTDLKYTILEKFYNTESRAINYYELINQFIGQTTIATYAVEELKNNRLIRQSNIADKLELTPVGAELYEAVKEERQKAANADKQREREYKIAKFALLVALIPAIIGVFDFILKVIDFFC